MRSDISSRVYRSMLLRSALEHARRALEASCQLPDNVRETSKFHENLDFRGHARDHFLLGKSPQGIESKQRMHLWIALQLI